VHFTRRGGRLRSTWRLLLKEISGFGVVGAVCFAADLGLFQLLYAHLGVGAVTAKVASTLVATTMAYLGHRFWSFSHRVHQRPARQYAVFALINGFTLLFGAVVVAVVRYPLHHEGVLLIQIANLGSIAVGTVVRYFGYRQWVFTAPGPVAEEPEGADSGDPDERAAA
jgi:putative flippase GtrA